MKLSGGVGQATLNAWGKFLATREISLLVSHQSVHLHVSSSERFFKYFQRPSDKLISQMKPPFVAFVLAKRAWLERRLPHADVLHCFRWYRYAVNIYRLTWWRRRQRLANSADTAPRSIKETLGSEQVGLHLIHCRGGSGWGCAATLYTNQRWSCWLGGSYLSGQAQIYLARSSGGRRPGFIC